MVLTLHDAQYYFRYSDRGGRDRTKDKDRDHDKDRSRDKERDCDRDRRDKDCVHGRKDKVGVAQTTARILLSGSPLVRAFNVIEKFMSLSLSLLIG